MRTIIMLFLIAVCISVHAQTDNIPTARDGVTLEQAPDSSRQYIETTDQKDWEERNLAGLRNLVDEQKERLDRERKRAFIRIGIGAIFLGALVLGWIRKKKKPVS